MHSHDWNVEVYNFKRSLTGKLSIIRLLSEGDRFKLEKNIEHTEYSGIEGVSFLSARPNNKE